LVELAKSIIGEKAGAAARLKEHNTRRVEALRNQVGKPKPKRGGWDETSRQVRSLLNGSK